MLYIKIVSHSLRTQYTSIRKTNLLMLHKEVMVVHCDTDTKEKGAVCIEFGSFFVNPGGTYVNHYSLKHGHWSFLWQRSMPLIVVWFMSCV
jgi:hypothetical protein